MVLDGQCRVAFIIVYYFNGTNDPKPKWNLDGIYTAYSYIQHVFACLCEPTYSDMLEQVEGYGAGAADCADAVGVSVD